MRPQRAPKERRSVAHLAARVAGHQPDTGRIANPRAESAAPGGLTVRTLLANIGLEVRRLRKSMDLTVEELGAVAGISAGMLSKIENGGVSPSLGTLDALARAINVPITRLFPAMDEQKYCPVLKAGARVRIERRGTKGGLR
jgi:DNA-binding XRE family transcriptional regulator